jgi:hypothetical protein
MNLVRVRSIALGAGIALIATAFPFAAVQAKPIVPVQTAAVCDPIDPAACLLPFPNDFFTTPADTETGLRINLSADAMPRNGSEVTEGGEGKPVDPTEWNRNDGWSPGAMVMTFVPDIDLHQTWGTADRAHSEVGPGEHGYFDYRDQLTDIGLSTAADSPMVILDADTGERFPFWSELDTHPNAMDDPATPIDETDRVLILRPARNFDEGHRYIVAMRNLKNATGATIPAGAAFASIRDNVTPTLPELPFVAARRAQYQSDILPTLEAAGIARNDLYIAWDFTVASGQNIAERALTIRDDTFERVLGDPDLSDRKVEGAAPEFTVENTEDRTDGWRDSFGVDHQQQIRRVRGTITVPNYMDRIQQTTSRVEYDHEACVPNDFEGGQECVTYTDAPAPGSRFYDDPQDADTLPDQNPVESELHVPWVCDVVLSEDGVPAGKQFPGLYGHGLLGTRDQLGDLKTPRRNGPFMGCGLDWWGMSSVDLPTVVTIIGDLSNMPSLADRAQQGFLNFMVMGRALVHPEGLASAPAFQDADGHPLINASNKADGTGEPSKLFYDGNSQGGIMGGSLVALSPDIHRGILGVTGMNYSTLLQRSVDWEDLYAIPYYANYSDPIEQQLGFALMQMLWDRGEANGFAAHMTNDPYPNTPKHEVLLQVAYGDHQVTNHAAEVEAATIGAPLMEQYAAHWAPTPQIDVAEYPYEGSALVYWNSGNATPPNANIPPLPEDGGGDPHSHPRDENASGWQEAHFLMTGWLLDVCNGGPYLTKRHPVNAGTMGSCVQPSYPAGTEFTGQ